MGGRPDCGTTGARWFNTAVLKNCRSFIAKVAESGAVLLTLGAALMLGQGVANAEAGAADVAPVAAAPSVGELGDCAHEVNWPGRINVY
ncbi:hypothetical protein NUG22_18465 [Saccharothrix longispora]|nr:hypothetical protein [Saccharothrix longispora]